MRVRWGASGVFEGIRDPIVYGRWVYKGNHARLPPRKSFPALERRRSFRPCVENGTRDSVGGETETKSNNDGVPTREGGAGVRRRIGTARVMTRRERTMKGWSGS